MSDDEDETHCPLCVEEMDLSDQNFLPCPCGYRVIYYFILNKYNYLLSFCPILLFIYNFLKGLYVVLASY